MNSTQARQAVAQMTTGDRAVSGQQRTPRTYCIAATHLTEEEEVLESTEAVEVATLQEQACLPWTQRTEIFPSIFLSLDHQLSGNVTACSAGADITRVPPATGGPPTEASA